MFQTVLQLRTLNQAIQGVVANPEVSWETKYSVVFSEAYSKRVYACFSELNLSFDYYDPDADYEDDVLAFAKALDERMVEVSALLNSAPRVDVRDFASSLDRANALPFVGRTWIATAVHVEVPSGLSEDEARVFVKEQLALASAAAPALTLQAAIFELTPTNP